VFEIILKTVWKVWIWKRLKIKRKGKTSWPLTFQPGRTTGPTPFSRSGRVPTFLFLFLTIADKLTPSVTSAFHPTSSPFLCSVVRRSESRRAWPPPPLSLPARECQLRQWFPHNQSLLLLVVPPIKSPRERSRK
jgi:hypothetical protein